MKKVILWIVGACLLVGLIAGATVIYNNYMEENKPSNVVIVGGKNDRTDGTGGEETESGGSESQWNGESGASTEKGDDGTESVTSVGSDTTSKETEEETGTEEETVSPYLAPDFTVYDIDGNPVKLSDYRGRPIVLNFWASDCYYCVQEMPDFQEMYEKYGDEVVFLMVCHVGFANRSVEHEQSFIDKKGYTFPVYFDTDLDAVYTYGISGIPQTYFIDRNFDLYTYIPGMADAESLELCIGWIIE